MSCLARACGGSDPHSLFQERQEKQEKVEMLVDEAIEVSYDG